MAVNEAGPACPRLRADMVSLLEGRGAELRAALNERTAGGRTDALSSLVRSCLKDAGLCVMGGALSYWDGVSYVPADRGDVLLTLSNVLADAGAAASDVRRMGDMPLACAWDRVAEPDPGLVAFDDCVYDVRGGRRLAHDRSLPVTWRAGYALGDDPKCPRWDSFLAEVLPDPSVRSCLQEFFGMCFVDRSRLSIEKMAVLIGGGANGKSVVLETVTAALGRERVGRLSPDQLADPKQAVSLMGKAANFAPDVRRGAAFDSALKALASAQDVQGWQLYHGGVTFSCPPLAFALNEMPEFRDLTDAFFRRLLVFRFGVTVDAGRQDRRLAAKLAATELPGVFMWMQEGRRRLVESGGRFTESAAMDAEIENLKMERRPSSPDPVEGWMRANGWSAMPLFDGQTPAKVRASDVVSGIGGVSAGSVTRSMARLGVECARSAGTFYYLYKES